MIKGSVEVERKVLDRVIPDLDDRVRLENSIKSLIEVIKDKLRDIDIPIKIELVGSTAKDTYLRDNLDIDLFLCFPISTSRQDLERFGLFIGRSILSNIEECFAEHPYLRGEFESYKTEIVPCYSIEYADQKLSAVDRTPLHTKYIQKYISNNQKNEVRLFKQFLKGINCYGAEAEIEGFSGYLCEILILRYNTFQNLIKEASKWIDQTILYLKKEDFPTFDTPLVFIDPVDGTRNVSSALSKEKFKLFIKACKEYIKKPQITFFFPNKLNPLSLDEIKKQIKGKEFIGIKIKKPDIIVENLYPQVRKAVKAVTDLCIQNDFSMDDSFFHITDNSIYIVLNPLDMNISETMTHVGPPSKLKKNSNDFMKKWDDNSRTIKKPYEKDGRLYVDIQRQYTDIKELLKDQITTLSLGKHIDDIVKCDFKILTISDLLSEKLLMLWTEYLDKRMSWER